VAAAGTHNVPDYARQRVTVVQTMMVTQEHSEIAFGLELENVFEKFAVVANNLF
jgi:hypothetical protein